MVEAGDRGASSSLSAWRFVDQPWAIPVFGYLAAIGVALALIDLDVRRLPDAIVLPSYPVRGACCLPWRAGARATGPRLLRAAIGGAALLGGLLRRCRAQPGGMGFGDVKLAGLLGAALAWLGWGAFAVGAFAAFLAGGSSAIVLLATRRAGAAARCRSGRG